MRTFGFILILLSNYLIINFIQGQNADNCFLKDFTSKDAIIPSYFDFQRTSNAATVNLTIDCNDTVSEVSKYIFGNAVAVWVSPDVNNATIVSYLNELSPTLIRFPGGSWSDVYFWNGSSK